MMRNIANITLEPVANLKDTDNAVFVELTLCLSHRDHVSQKWERIRGWSWPIIIMVCITLVSGTNDLVVPNLGLFSSDKLKHFLVFGLLATAIIRNFSPKRKSITMILIAGIATSLFGMGDEIWQSFTPGRTLDIWDWLADTIGAFVAAIAYRNLHAYRRILEIPISQRKQSRSASNSVNIATK